MVFIRFVVHVKELRNVSCGCCPNQTITLIGCQTPTDPRFLILRSDLHLPSNFPFVAGSGPKISQVPDLGLKILKKNIEVRLAFPMKFPDGREGGAASQGWTRDKCPARHTCFSRRKYLSTQFVSLVLTWQLVCVFSYILQVVW